MTRSFSVCAVAYAVLDLNDSLVPDWVMKRWHDKGEGVEAVFDTRVVAVAASTVVVLVGISGSNLDREQVGWVDCM